MDFEILYIPKLSLAEFDEKERIKLDSTRDDDTDSTIDIFSEYNINLDGNDEIEEKTKHEKDEKNHCTDMSYKAINKNIVNNNSNKQLDETPPMKLQQIAIKYTGPLI